MGDLWKEINEDIIDFIYINATPDSSQIIAALDVLATAMHLAPPLHSSLYTRRDNVVYVIRFRIYDLSSR